MYIDQELLHKLIPHAKDSAIKACTVHLNNTMQYYDITTPVRQAMFIAQIAHESGSLNYFRELWGPTEAQRHYDLPFAKAKELGNDSPDAIRIAALNNSTPGKFYRGRGGIQITGFANYKLYGGILKLDLAHEPMILETPKLAMWVSGAFWEVHKLNKSADLADVRTNTRIINGGLNGFSQRLAYFEQNLDLLQATA